jgi:hypothetical protein
MRLRTIAVLLASCALLGHARAAFAQGVTTGSITGVVTDPQQQPVPGATVLAVHEPSGTRYEAVTRADGRFDIPGMRVGGPYTVTASLTGFQPQTTKDVIVSLGVANDLKLSLRTLTVTEEVTVTAESDPIFSSARTGAATSVSRETIAALPTLSDRLDSFTRLSPQFSGSGSFAGQDNRLNNITVDGSYFNNSFGLAGAPGDRTGVAPISMAAVEEVQVNVAPYDVRQGNFVGAGINTVTRSGTNQYRGELVYRFRNESMVGKEAKERTVNPGTFDFKRYGGSLSGPIVKNKLFFFGNVEDDSLESPATTFRANTGGETVGGNVTRVLASDLDALSSFLKQRFDYDTGPYQDYPSATPARRYLAKVDYNMNARNKLSARYLHLDSDTDVLVSDSSSLGFGSRRTRTTGLNFQASNYTILENIRSGVVEWNSIIGTNAANTFIAGFSKHDESRGQLEKLFPMVDILQAGSVYTTFGSEPFTPNNELRYKTFQATNNFTTTRGNHGLVFGATLQRYESENVFFPGSQSVYTYSSLADFYTDANGFLANPNRTTSPVTLRRFQVRWMNIPGLDKPLQPLEVWYGGVYAQDDWQASKNVKLTIGLRVDMPKFGDTGFANADADGRTFRDETGASVQYSTKKLPDSNLQFSPRVGFNWDLTGDRRTQVRGGTGIFAGPPLYVWISNQIGNTGVLTGFLSQDNTTAFPFNPNPNRYKPTNVTGAPASSYELALTDKEFKFPQQWRTNFAVDRRLPYGLTATGEFIYMRDVNGIYYINANLPAAQTAFTGADARPRWTSNRIYSHISNAVVMKNQDIGRSWHAAASLEKRYRAGFLKAAYSYGRAKNTIDPGSIAFGSWNNNQHPGDPNNPGLGFSTASPGHRVFLAGSYRFEYLKFGATTVSFFWQGFQGNTSYVFGGDINGDGGTSNDLLYIHRDTSEMNFAPVTVSGRTFSAAEQAQAWETYIAQDGYLSKHRGEYAERGAVFLPMVYRGDLQIAQDLFRNMGNNKHSLQLRLDILNVGNLINKNWGVGQRLVNNQPLIPTSARADAQGRAQYTLRVVNNQLLTKSLEQTANLGTDINPGDVYRLQLQLRYSFN